MMQSDGPEPDKYDEEKDGGSSSGTAAKQDLKRTGGHSRTLNNASRLSGVRVNAPEPPLPIAGTSPLEGFGDTFTAEKAEKAKGNFLLTIGFPQAGKSTFHSHLFRMCEEYHSVESLHLTGNATGSVDPLMEARLNAWRTKFISRENVDATPQGDVNIFEVAFKVIPSSRPSLPLELRIIEVSGENLKELNGSTSRSQIASLPQSIGRLMQDDNLNNVKVAVAIMLDPRLEAEPIELLVDGLLSYMRVNAPKRLKETSFCLLLPKPLSILEALKGYKEHYPEQWASMKRTPTLENYTTAGSVDMEAVKCYVALFKKNLWLRLKKTAPSGNLLLSKIYVGEMENQSFQDDHGNTEELEIMTETDYRDVRRIFAFLYESFHNGKKLNSGILRRIFGG